MSVGFAGEPAIDLESPNNMMRALKRLRRLADQRHGDGPHGVDDRLGRTDHITLLPNRVSFAEDFATTAQRDGAVLVLLTLADAKHFNELLRALGHAYSEDFVREGAQRLKTLLPAHASLYHVSVLSLAFVMPDTSGHAATALAREIVAAFRAPIVCQNIPVNTKPGVGITPIVAGKTNASELLRSTLAAAQDSRGTSAGFSFYDSKTDEAHVRAFKLLTDLPRAFDSADQLHLHYQPRMGLPAGRCVGAEALVRWTHPQLGSISPAEFIPLAESTALIEPLTEWIIRNALDSVAGWQSHDREVRISVNVSPRNLEDAAFPDLLQWTASQRGIDPRLVEIEFTEGLLTSNWAFMSSQMEKVRQFGFEIAIDDFGSGYSNMSNLGRIPARYLKIDKSFVLPMQHDEKSRKLARSIIELAHGLGYEVVAEGIESVETVKMLSDWNCDEGQGYYFSRPLPGPQFVDWLAQNV